MIYMIQILEKHKDILILTKNNNYHKENSQILQIHLVINQDNNILRMKIKIIHINTEDKY